MDNFFYISFFTGFVGFIGILVFFILGDDEEQESERKMHNYQKKTASILVAVGSGGHTSEILRLMSTLGSQYVPRYYVLAETDTMSEEKVLKLEANRSHGEGEHFVLHIPRSREVGQLWLSSFITTVYASMLSLPIVFRIRPDVILCNGPGTCIPLCMSGILLKLCFLSSVKIIYVESICRVETLSLSARILYYLANHILVQWPQLKIKYPRVKYIGRLI